MILQKSRIPANPTSREKVSPFFQTTLIILSSIVLMLSFFYRMSHFNVADDPSVPESITPKKLREFGGFPESILVGLEIARFQEFDVTKNKFEFTGNLWFELQAGAVSLSTLENFKFDRGEIKYRSMPDTKLYGSRLMVRYVVRVAFNTGLIYQDFPFDDHRIYLVLTHPFLSPEDVVFDAHSVNFATRVNLLPFGWRKVDHSVRSGFTSANLTNNNNQRIIMQPMVSFVLDVERYGYRYSLAMLLPILLIYFLMFFSLSVDGIPSVTVTLGCITGILAYRFVMEQLSPISGDLMKSDHFFFLILLSSFLIFVLNKIDLFLISLSMKHKRFYIVLIHVFTTLVSTYILLS